MDDDFTPTADIPSMDTIQCHTSGTFMATTCWGRLQRQGKGHVLPIAGLPSCDRYVYNLQTWSMTLYLDLPVRVYGLDTGVHLPTIDEYLTLGPSTYWSVYRVSASTSASLSLREMNILCKWYLWHRHALAACVNPRALSAANSPRDATKGSSHQHLTHLRVWLTVRLFCITPV